MKVRFTQRADKDYFSLSPRVRKAFAKQLEFLLHNLQHPSLHAKKYDEGNKCGKPELIAPGGFISKSKGTST